MSKLNEFKLTIECDLATYENEVDVTKITLHMDHVLKQYFRDCAVISPIRVDVTKELPLYLRPNNGANK